MPATIPVGNWQYTTVVVRDYRQVVCNFARFFGIDRWEVIRVDGKYLSNARFEGTAAQHRWISVFGHNGQLGIELIQPVDGPSGYQAMLDSVGEGMYGVAASVCEPGRFETLRADLAGQGIGIRQSGTFFDAVDYYQLDTRDALSNVIVEVHCPRRPDWQSVIKPDEVLHMDLKHLGPQFLPTQKMLHIGVVCTDRNRTKANLQTLFGMERWIEFQIETGVSMEDTTYYGQPCHHAYDNHVGRLGDLCFELITPRSDTCVYDEFLKERGEGMHHTFPTLCSKEAFTARLPELEKHDMPVIQGGRIGDLMEYYYIDTRRYLPGITTEVVIPLRPDWLELFFPNPGDASILTGD